MHSHLAEEDHLKARIENLEGQINYMCQEIAKALQLPVQSPADTVGSVRDLMMMAEQSKETAEQLRREPVRG